MKAVIIGCGRVGAGLADELDRAGWEVLILDVSTAAFDRLPAGFGGTALRGDGTDEDVLRRAGAENADLFLALTEGDNRNVMACQLGVEVLGAQQTVAKINDPVRAEAYAHLGIATLCRTNLMSAAVLSFLGQAVPAMPGIYSPAQPHVPAATDPALAGSVSSPSTPVTAARTDPATEREARGVPNGAPANGAIADGRTANGGSSNGSANGGRGIQPGNRPGGEI